MMSLAQNDPTRLPHIAAVPLRDGLAAFVETLRGEALVQYRHEQVLFAQGALKKAPKVPDLLKAPKRRKGPPLSRTPEKPAFITALEQGD